MLTEEIKRQLLEWLLTNRVSKCQKLILCTVLDLKSEYTVDPDSVMDLIDILVVIKEFPFITTAMDKISAISPTWGRLISNLTKLEILLASESDEAFKLRTYRKMKELGCVNSQ